MLRHVFFGNGIFTFLYFKKNQNAPRPSEHPPVKGGEMSKRLGGIKGCKYKTSSWHLNGFSPMKIILSQQCNVGEKPTVYCTLTLITMQGHKKNSKTKQKQCCSTPSHMVVVIIYYYIGYKYKATTWYLTGFPNGSNLGSTV